MTTTKHNYEPLVSVIQYMTSLVSKHGKTCMQGLPILTTLQTEILTTETSDILNPKIISNYLFTCYNYPGISAPAITLTATGRFYNLNSGDSYKYFLIQ